MTFDDRGKGAQPPADIWKIQLDLLSNQNSFNVFNIPRPASNALMNYKVLCTDNTNGSKFRKGNLRRPAHGFFLVAWNAEREVDRNSVGCGNQKNPMLFGESKCICHPWAETLQHLPQKSSSLSHGTMTTISTSWVVLGSPQCWRATPPRTA